MLERLKPMLIKEFIQILRDPRMRMVLFGVPIIQMLIFGYAVNTDVRRIATAVYDLDRSPASRDLVSRFTGGGAFAVERMVQTESEAREVIDGGQVKALIRLDHGFAEDLAAGRTARVQIILDASDANTAAIVMGYASRIAATFNGSVLMERMQRNRGVRPEAEPVSLAWRAWFNPDLESRNYFLPGVIALLVMVISIILSSMAIVREREIGTMEQIMVTPIGRLEFILGKTLPFALIGFANVAMVCLVAVFWFKVPLEGSLALLFLCTGLFLLSTLGVGLFISTVSQTQQQAMMSTFFFALPAILLSGFVYPIANMPGWVQLLTYLNPLRYFIIILRGIFLKGVGFPVLWPQMAALGLLGSLLLLLAAGRFKKTTG